MKLASLFLIVVLACELTSCKKEPEQKPRSWTVNEIRSLRGKTKEEIRALLGKPTGLYTMEARGRWHYPGMLILREGTSLPDKKGVIIYFSQMGEHRCSIVEIMDRWEPTRRTTP